MTEQTLIEGVEPAPERTLVERLQDEADLCRNDGADDIARLLDEAVAELERKSDAIQRLWRERDALRAEVEALRAERDGLMQTLRGEMDENLRLRALGGARPDENITAMTERLIRELEALRAQQTGWRWVPVDPTPEMQSAGVIALHGVSVGDLDATDTELRVAYRAMLAAAPAAPGAAAPAQPATKAARVHAIVNAGPLPGMSEAFDAHMGAECWTDPAYAPDAATWAAAWKAAKAQPTQEPDASLTVAHMGGFEDGKRARQPLTDEQITAMRQAGYLDADDYPDAWAYERGVRDAERAHKIGEQQC